jgi:hypothetical protein
VLNIGSDVMFKSHKKGAKGPNNNTHKIVLLVVNIHSGENYLALGHSAIASCNLHKNEAAISSARLLVNFTMLFCNL